MMETKYSTGPWSVKHVGPHWNNPEIAQHEILDGEDEVVAEHIYELPDAHLIAAAPEMYEMLELIVAACELSPHKEDIINKLLAKARGEQ